MTILTNILAFPGIREIWNNLGYYFGVSVAFIIAAGLVEGTILYFFDTTGKCKGIIGGLLDLIQMFAKFLIRKIVYLYDDIVYAITKK